MGDRKAVRGALWNLVSKLESGLYGVGSVGSSEKCGYLGEAHSKELDRWLGQLALGISAEATVPGAHPT